MISNQSQEIQTLQKSIKDFTSSSKTKDDEVHTMPVITLSVADLLKGDVDCVPKGPGRVTENANHRGGGKEEGERKGTGRPPCAFGRAEQQEEER